MRQMFARVLVSGIALAAVLAGSPAEAAIAEKQIFSESVSVVVPLDAPVLTVQGRQNLLDPKLYDVTVAARAGAAKTVSVFTGGAAQAPFRLDLLSSDAVATDLQIGMRYRYDDTRPVCVVGVDGSCAARLGFDPMDARWLVGTPRIDNGNISVRTDPSTWRMPSVSYDSPGADQSELIVDVTLRAPTGLAQSSSIRIPFLGQVAHTVPSS